MVLLHLAYPLSQAKETLALHASPTAFHFNLSDDTLSSLRMPGNSGRRHSCSLDQIYLSLRKGAENPIPVSPDASYLIFNHYPPLRQPHPTQFSMFNQRLYRIGFMSLVLRHALLPYFKTRYQESGNLESFTHRPFRKD